jgi:hypothetical protein
LPILSQVRNANNPAHRFGVSCLGEIGKVVDTVRNQEDSPLVADSFDLEACTGLKILLTLFAALFDGNGFLWS